LAHVGNVTETPELKKNERKKETEKTVRSKFYSNILEKTKKQKLEARN